MTNHDQFCDNLTEWSGLMCKLDPHFERAWVVVRRAIVKSCLLDRTMNCGERPSQTPCPVHKGKWSGINWGRAVDEARAAGCRCDKHKCGCTTGWQPDEHCGCGVKP